MEVAFRSGVGDYIHAQGPLPQQFEEDGLGQIVASVGKAIGPVAFSTLAAKEEWLKTDVAMAFMRAYRMARELAITGSPEEIARLEAEFFPEIHIEALANTVRFYQQLGCWSPHLEITQQAFEVAVDVFLHSKVISERPAYDLAVYPVPTI